MPWDPTKLELSGEYAHNTGYWYKFDKLVVERISRWQTIRVVEHSVFGKVLLIDCDVMGSEHDNTYDEAMLELLPKDAKRVLVIGGGDCSLARNLCKLSSVAHVTVCDIDPAVPEVCREHLPQELNEKVTVLHEDAFNYLQAHKDEYDVLFDDMLPQPHGAGIDYWVDLAKTFRGKYVIGQTGGHASDLPGHIRSSLRAVGAEVTQISRYVPTYLEHWSFTRYRLPKE